MKRILFCLELLSLEIVLAEFCAFPWSGFGLVFLSWLGWHSKIESYSLSFYLSTYIYNQQRNRNFQVSKSVCSAFLIFRGIYEVCHEKQTLDTVDVHSITGLEALTPALSLEITSCNTTSRSGNTNALVYWWNSI